MRLILILMLLIIMGIIVLEDMMQGSICTNSRRLSISIFLFNPSFTINISKTQNLSHLQPSLLQYQFLCFLHLSSANLSSLSCDNFCTRCTQGILRNFALTQRLPTTAAQNRNKKILFRIKKFEEGKIVSNVCMLALMDLFRMIEAFLAKVRRLVFRVTRDDIVNTNTNIN